jgi:tetratricopeptide (TPR) repeat protein
MDGLLYEREHKQAEAIAAYRDSLSMNADFVPAHRRLAILLKESDPSSAATHAAKVIAFEPADAEIAKLQEELSKAGVSPAPPGAHPTLPPPKRARFASGRAHVDALLEEGKDDEALRFLDESVGDDPQACWAYERMRAIRIRLHDADGAEKARKDLSACRGSR